MEINQIYWFAHFTRNTDHNAVSGKGCVQCGNWAIHSILPIGFKHAVNILGPMNVFCCDICEALNLKPLLGEVIRGTCIKNTINKDDLQPVNISPKRTFFIVKQRCYWRVCLYQRVRAGEFPILVTAFGQSHAFNACECGFACRRGPCAALRHRQRRKPRRDSLNIQFTFRHDQATSARMSA